MTDNVLGKRLTELRKNRKIGQSQVAKDFCVSQNAIHNWETGKRLVDSDLLIKFAKYYNVSTDYLLGLTCETESNILPKRLVELRKEIGKSQYQVSVETGLSQSAISYWETGERDPASKVIIEFSRYYGVTSDYLLGLSDKRNFKE